MELSSNRLADCAMSVERWMDRARSFVWLVADRSVERRLASSATRERPSARHCSSGASGAPRVGRGRTR